MEVGFYTQVYLTPRVCYSMSGAVLPSKNVSPHQRQAEEGGYVMKYLGILVIQGGACSPLGGRAR